VVRVRGARGALWLILNFRRPAPPTMADAPPSPSTAPARAEPRRRRRKLLLIGIICVAPVVASYAFYYLSRRVPA